MTKPNPNNPRLKHGHLIGGESYTHAAWRAMRQRCMNPKSKDWPEYGGLGIRCCPEWDKFATFLADMGLRPACMTLERINNAKGYCKRNCKWATRREQAFNRRSSHMIRYAGEVHCLSAWAERFNINEETLRARVRAGWHLDRIMQTPSQAGYHMRRK